MKFRSQFEKIDFEPTCAGDRYHILYTRVDNPDGSWFLKECGREDIQEKINSACPPTLADIIERVRRGDSSLLGDSSSAEYVDTTPLFGKTIGDVVVMSEASKAYVEAAGKVISEENSEVKETAANEP